MPPSFLLALAAAVALQPSARDSVDAACTPGDTARAAGGVASAPYASAALRALVTRACAANRRLPPEFVRYAAQVESEVGLVLDQPIALPGAVAGTAAARAEVAGQVEQVASAVRYERRGDYEMRVIGYRLQALGLGPSALTYLPTAWTVPSLYGNRLALLFTERADSTRRARSRDGAGSTRRGSPRPFATAFHPLAEDRERVYRYTGGDTVATIQAGGGRRIPLVRVLVDPVRVPPGRAWMFAGELLLDGERAQLVRMRGRFVATGVRDPSLVGRAIRATTGLDGDVLVDLENGEVLGRYWLPRAQRLELQATSGVSEARAVIRVTSRFRDYDVTERVAPTAEGLPAAVGSEGGAALAGDTLFVIPARRSFAPADSVRRYAAWQRELGLDTRLASAHDFDAFLAPRRRLTGPPVLRVQGRRGSDFVRVNRVEGLYTGAAMLLALRDRAPGALVRATGGWSWGERTARGGIEGAFPRGAWLATARAERILESTNDFDASVGGSGSMFAGLAGDPYDYVDRRAAALGVARELGRAHTAAWRVEGSVRSDAQPVASLQQQPFGRRAFRALRPVDAGRYALLTTTLDFGRNVIGDGLQSGVGGILSAERATGDLAWTRVEARLRARRVRGPLILAGRLDAGAATAGALPAQQLYEVGGVQGLPGYAYKEFVGDRAVLARAGAMYTLPLAARPVRVGRWFLPPLAPALSATTFAGWTDASSTGRATLDRLGWETTGRVRSTVDLRVRFFGGAFGAGFARPVDRAAPWRLVASFDGQL